MWNDKKFAYGRQVFTGCLFVALLLGPGYTLAFGQVVCRAVYGADCNRRYDHNSYLGSHNSFANRDDGWDVPNQHPTITKQLDHGVRFLNLDVYLMRQFEEVIGGVSYWREVTYQCCDELPNPLPPDMEVALAHDPIGFGHIPYTNRRFRTLKEGLEEIRAWMEAHPGEVVSLVLENQVPPSKTAQDYLEQAITDSCIRPLMFYLDRANTGMEVPGRPTDEAWDVVSHGYPTLQQLVKYKKRLVYLNAEYDANYQYQYQVQTVGGPEDHNVNKWWWARGESYPLDSFAKQLFVMEHAPLLAGVLPGLPGGNVTFYTETILKKPYLFWLPLSPYPYNEGIVLDNRRDDLLNRYHRLPTHPQFDFYNYDLAHPYGTDPDPYNGGGWTKPVDWVVDLNQRWAEMPEHTASYSVSPAPNQFGWHGGPSLGDQVVKVTLTPGDNVYSILSCKYGEDETCRFRDNQGRLKNGLGEISWDRPVIQQWVGPEGKTTVTFAAVGPLNGPDGVPRGSGPRQYVDVKIDRTPPELSIAGNIGVYTIDVSPDIVCSAVDNRSGVQSLSLTRINQPAYQYNIGDNVIPVTAKDYADNVTTRDVTFRVIITSASLGNLTRRFVTNAGIANSLQAKLDAAQRAIDRGDLAQKAQHIETYVNALQNHIGRFITADQAAILIRLARAW